MGMFQHVATAEFKVLFMVLLMGHAFRAIPANPANACSEDLYLRVVLTHLLLHPTAFAAALLLLNVRECVLLAAGTAGAGIGSVAAGWQRRSLRGTLLLAVLLSFAASVLAVVTFEDGFLYRTGCDAAHAGYGAGSPLGVLLIGLFALVHGFFAWVAVTQN